MKHKDIIKRAGGVSNLSRLGNWPIPRVQAWNLNNSIPAKYWPGLQELQIATLEELAAGVAKSVGEGLEMGI
jgi:hypothetical protein